MTKKSCEKHKIFNYYCDDCQEINRKYEIKQKVKRLERGDFEILDADRAPPRRRFPQLDIFRGKQKIGKYLKYIIPVIILVVVILSIVWFWPAWMGPIRLNAQLYDSKVNYITTKVNFYEFYFLNFWSINFFFNKTALMGAIIGCIIMSLPPNQNFLAIIGTKLRFGKPSRLKALIFWWTAGFVLFYLIGMILDFDGSFSWMMYLIELGEYEITPLMIFFDAFDVLSNQTNMDIQFIFVYARVYLPLIYYVFAICGFRIILNIVSNYYLRRNDYKILTNALLLSGLIFGALFFSLPTFSLNGIHLIQMWSFLLAFFILIGASIPAYIVGRKAIARNPKKNIFLRKQQIRIGVLVGGLVILILIPVMISIGPMITISNTAVYSEYEWDRRINREIMWTRASAGLDMFEERPISNFTLSSSPENDTQMINQIRQFDQYFAVQSLAAKIGTTYEGLADSDIVYLNGTEYWVAPKTIRLSQFSDDPVATNTELYDHVEGFLAMDTSTGELVNVSSIFNIAEDYPIFFGESESERFLESQGFMAGLGAYDNNILLGTEWRGEIENNNYVYEAAPDGSLEGLEDFWFNIGLGLGFGYVFEGGAHQYLINRNVKNRVQSILLPQLTIDNDPYLVFDSQNGKMYYVVSIYTSIDIGSYSKSPLLRFLGVSVVDVINGELTFYKNPALIESEADPMYDVWKYYLNRYDWGEVPSWLKNQLRYPEDLFEAQLRANYLYHVQELKTWKRGDDFHERPENGDLFYIETDLGNGIEFVGLDLVEYRGTEARTLAGMYVVRHGDNFGEALFYHTRNATENLIGPKTARDTYQTEATQEISLIAGARMGNTLLYPLGGSVYYYIPTYSTVGGLQQLKLAGFVEAFTRQVGYGSDADEAYDALGNFGPRTFTLTSDAGNPDIDGLFTLNWTRSKFVETYTVYRNDTLLAGNLPDSQTTYTVSGIDTGSYEFYIIASNEFGNTTTNRITIEVKRFAIYYQFDIDNIITLPDDLASFRIQLENFNETIDAEGYNVKVNLSLFRVGGGNFSILVPPSTIIENSSFIYGAYSGMHFTLVNTTLFSGEGIILNGFVNSTRTDIIIRYKWTLIVNDIIIYTSEEKFITVT